MNELADPMMGEPGPSEEEMQAGCGVIAACMIGLMNNSTFVQIMCLVAVFYFVYPLHKERNDSSRGQSVHNGPDDSPGMDFAPA